MGRPNYYWGAASNRAKSEDSINTSEGTPSTRRDADWFFYAFSGRLVFLCIFWQIGFFMHFLADWFFYAFSGRLVFYLAKQINPARTEISEPASKKLKNNRLTK